MVRCDLNSNVGLLQTEISKCILGLVCRDQSGKEGELAPFQAWSWLMVGLGSQGAQFGESQESEGSQIIDLYSLCLESR